MPAEYLTKFALGEEVQLKGRVPSESFKIGKIIITAESIVYKSTGYPYLYEEEENLILVPEMVEVIVGQRWRHSNGKVYEVVGMTNEFADEGRKEEYPLTVVYCEVTDRLKIWSLPLIYWHNKRTLLEESDAQS